MSLQITPALIDSLLAPAHAAGYSTQGGPGTVGFAIEANLATLLSTAVSEAQKLLQAVELVKNPPIVDVFATTAFNDAWTALKKSAVDGAGNVSLPTLVQQAYWFMISNNQQLFWVWLFLIFKAAIIQSAGGAVTLPASASTFPGPTVLIMRTFAPSVSGIQYIPATATSRFTGYAPTLTIA